jgi:hypothetical protein
MRPLCFALHPDTRKRGPSLAAVKTWPTSVAKRQRRATASLDRGSTRGLSHHMGRDEETGFESN